MEDMPTSNVIDCCRDSSFEEHSLLLAFPLSLSLLALSEKSQGSSRVPVGENERELLSKPGEGRSRVLKNLVSRRSFDSSFLFPFSQPQASSSVSLPKYRLFLLSLFFKMGRKKIVIERITDERNRQVRGKEKRKKRGQREKKVPFKKTSTSTTNAEKKKFKNRKNRSPSPSARTA